MKLAVVPATVPVALNERDEDIDINEEEDEVTPDSVGLTNGDDCTLTVGNVPGA